MVALRREDEPIIVRFAGHEPADWTLDESDAEYNLLLSKLDEDSLDARDSQPAPRPVWPLVVAIAVAVLAWILFGRT